MHRFFLKSQALWGLCDAFAKRTKNTILQRQHLKFEFEIIGPKCTENYDFVSSTAQQSLQLRESVHLPFTHRQLQHHNTDICWRRERARFWLVGKQNLVKIATTRHHHTKALHSSQAPVPAAWPLLVYCTALHGTTYASMCCGDRGRCWCGWVFQRLTAESIPEIYRNVCVLWRYPRCQKNI